jgi:hypothetical protein
MKTSERCLELRMAAIESKDDFEQGQDHGRKGWPPNKETEPYMQGYANGLTDTSGETDEESGRHAIEARLFLLHWHMAAIDSIFGE